MRKLLMLTLAIMLLAFATSSATLTKTLTMGNANNIVHDDGNIWLYPSTFYSYPDLAIGEFSSDNFYDFGIHYKFGEESPLMLGVYFTTRQAFDIVDKPFMWQLLDDGTGTINVSNSGTTNNLPNRRIDLFLGYMMGQNPVGLHFDYISCSMKQEFDSIPGAPDTPAQKREECISNMGLDLGITMMQGKLDLSAGVDLLSFTDKNYLGNDENKPAGNMAFYFMGRYFHTVDPKITLVPHGKISIDNSGVEVYGNAGSATIAGTMTEEYEYSNMTVDLGLGMNYSPAAGINAVGDIGFMMSNGTEKFTDWIVVVDSVQATEEYKDNNTVIPYFRIGMDAAIFDWLDLRLGATSYWNSRVHEDNYVSSTAPPATYSWTEKWTGGYVSNNTYLGAGFHWGNFKIDTHVCPELILDGFNFISGETNEMNYQLTILYEMF
jgi:hypothetical protein